MPRYNIIITLCWLLSCGIPCLSESQVCYPPNKPLGGHYSPQRETYQAGDVVEYGCDDRSFPLSLTASQNPLSICQNSGTWSAVQDTFCDGPPLKPHRVELRMRKVMEYSITTVTDGIQSSCHQTTYADRITWIFTLERRSLISAVRIYGKRGNSYRLEVIVRQGSFGNYQISCGLQNFTIAAGRNLWTVFRCPVDTWGDNVFVKDWMRTEQFQTICEVEIFSKVVSSCEPPTISIPYGYLEYARASATLVCAEGYKRTTSQDIMCEQSRWEANGHYCEPDTRSTENTVVLILASVLGALVILVIISTVILLQCRRKRHWHKTSSASFADSTDKSYFSTPREFSKASLRMNSRTLGENDDPDEHEYSTVRYSNFLEKVQLPSKMPAYANYPR